MKLCDLHTHSVFSDGTWTPAELLEEAECLGLSAIALTDHNTVAGLPDFMAAARGREVEAIPGVEFSTDFEDKDVHIVALFVRECHYDTVTSVLHDAQMRKEQSNRTLVENLQNAGYAITYENVCKGAGGVINRAHVAAELVRCGYVSTVKEAFSTLLDPKFGLYSPPKRMTSVEAIGFIKSLGAVAVLAHPLLTMKEEQLRRFLTQAVPAGLDAMETEYSTYDEETTRLARKIAREFGLKRSGGSDFHGDRKPDIFLGSGKGELKVDGYLVEDLRNALK